MLWFSQIYYREYDHFQIHHDQEWNAATRKIILESTEQIENFNKQNLAIYKRNLENQARADQEAARLEQETKRRTVRMY